MDCSRSSRKRPESSAFFPRDFFAKKQRDTASLAAQFVVDFEYDCPGCNESSSCDKTPSCRYASLYRIFDVIEPCTEKEWWFSFKPTAFEIELSRKGFQRPPVSRFLQKSQSRRLVMQKHAEIPNGAKLMLE
jgi:hypothetical protein